MTLKNEAGEVTKNVKLAIFDITEASLPEGLTLSNGKISGIPIHIFKGTVAITATNSAGSDTKNVKLTIKAVKPKVLTGSLPAAKVGQEYNFTLEASGSEILTWSGENLPAGLTVDSNGKISGTPTENGKFKIAVTVSNEAGSKRKKLTLIVDPADVSANNSESSEHDSDSESITNETNESENITAVPQDITELDASTNSLVSNDNYMIAAVLPEIEVTESGLYEFTVSLDEKVPENSLLFWHSFPNGQDDNDDSAVFFDDEGEEIDTVPESYCVTVSVWLEPGIIYKPVIYVKLEEAR